MDPFLLLEICFFQDDSKIFFSKQVLTVVFILDGCFDVFPSPSQCPSWPLCDDNKWGDWMAKNCKKSCNRCDGKLIQ